MESKVILYNAHGVKIGETFARRARQLVNRQRAQWVEGENAVRFFPDMEHMDVDLDDPDTTTATPTEIQPNQIVFARWWGNYFYPGVTGEVFPDHVKIQFLDGYETTAPKPDVVPLQEAFDTMDFEGLWGGWLWSKGVLASQHPIIMNYNDGKVDRLDLKRLRAKWTT